MSCSTMKRAMPIVWVCPRCDRPFGRANRPHTCLAGMPIEAWLDERTDAQRRAAGAVLRVVRRYRGVVVEAVSVGVLVKRERTIIELRPKQRWLDVSFITTRSIASERIVRTFVLARGTCYVVHVRDASDVDAELRGWLASSLRGG
jgi:hypothetical protein